jgi:hypothetical protein
MTREERELLQNFLAQLTQIHGIPKDPEADALIARAVAQQPDAPYLLVQRALLLHQALDQAKAQIAELQQRGSGTGSGGFLSGNAWGRSGEPVATTGPVSVSGKPLSAPAGQVSMPEPPAAAPRAGGFGGAGSSFLGQAAATAAGVAGGAFLFQGLEGLLGHHGGTGLGWPGDHTTSAAPENVTVNEYFLNDNPNDQAGVAEAAGDDASLQEADWDGGGDGSDPSSDFI